MTVSFIERLPVELIQPIFRESDYDVSLPLASPRLAAKLSDKSLYNEACDYYLTSQHSLARRRQKEIQTRIFAAKWMTWDFFKSWVLHYFEPKGCLCGTRGCWDRKWPLNWEDASQMSFSRAHLPALAWVHCRLPMKLFTGAWNQGKIEFLRFLLWTTSMTVDWENVEVRQTVLQSRKNAVLQGNLEAVELFNHNRRLGKAPDLISVHFAVIQAGCDRSIVYDTLATANTHGKHDPWVREELEAWCASRITMGDPKGAWLQRKLEDVRRIGERGGYLDQEQGNYEVEGDKLIVHKLKWNEDFTFIGWVIASTTGGYYTIHDLSTSELGFEPRQIRLIRRQKWPEDEGMPSFRRLLFRLLPISVLD